MQAIARGAAKLPIARGGRVGPPLEKKSYADKLNGGRGKLIYRRQMEMQSRSMNLHLNLMRMICDVDYGRLID